MKNIHKEDEKTLREMAAKLPVKFDGSGIHVNHYRRLKKAFVDEGEAGVRKYLNKNHAQLVRN